ncbi:response regulator transcription factor [Planctomyces sp. SH-PL14]|uniref:response regulator transcription factor n=1 Tax=Planctomyces sp. SH-PL14 TaxID=1632864 RepID=UPI00078BBDAC|nr:response regulator transcription factor [Planctomyces sp. SH-PL14]AMV17544.1 Transcriptional activator protein CopR [Planctomyces sp. SH-PL14]
MSNVLVLEDHQSLRSSLERGLREEGHTVFPVSSRADGMNVVRTEPLDAIILDLQLPDGDGLQFLREVRRDGLAVPVLVASARDTVDERILGLDSGADDYLVKPFAFGELVARLRSLLRRAAVVSDSVLRHDDLQIDLLTRKVTRRGEEVSLTRRLFELLEYLLRHRNEVVTREMLARDVWKASTATWTNVIEVQIRELRRRIERPDWSRLLHTVRGEGYLLGDRP